MMIQDEELRSLYQVTGIERLQKLQMGLVQLEQEPNNQGVLEELRREIHGLRGDSDSVGVIAIVTLAQQLESIIKAIQRQELAFTLEVSDRLYQGLDAAGQLLHEAVSGESGDVDLAQLQDLLRSVLETNSPVQPDGPVEHPSVDLPTAAPLVSFYIEDDELREIYRTTSEARLQALATSLQQLEQGPDEATLEVLRRETHSLKGDSRAVEVDAVAQLTQVIETIVKDIQNQARSFTPDVRHGLDHGLEDIRQLVQEAVSGEPSGVDIDQALERLMSVAATTVGPALTVSVATESVSPSLVSAIADTELREIFRATSEERLQQLETNLLYLEKHPQDTATLAALMREAHSLKGDSRSTGVDSVEALAHALEDVLTSVQRQELELAPSVYDHLYQGLDAMGQLVQEAVTGEPVHIDTEQILITLRHIIPPLDTPEAEALPAGPLVETTALPLLELPLKEEDVTQIDTLRVQTRELDVLMAQVEELAVTRIQVAQTSAQTEQLIGLWEEWKTSQDQGEEIDPEEPSYEERLETLLLSLRSTVQENSSKLELVAEDLRDRIRKLQLIPLSIIFQPLPRVVRDLAKQQSKAVNLILEGEENAADKRLLQGIKDSLMHLVRNAIDHGIEPPKERIAAGKPATATLRVKAHQTAISLMIEITDDGRGLDTEQIKRTAMKRRLYGSEELEAMSVSQIQRLILAPGFSTRSFITEISGRGVGLDVVRTQVEQLKGSIQIDSIPGQGCTFRLQLSTALSTANVLLVETQGIPLALPIDFLQTSLLVSPEQIITNDGQDTIVVDNQTIPVANLIDVLELSDSPIYSWVARPSQIKSDRRPCVLIKVGNEQAGFFVDQLIDQREVVSKALNPLLKRVRNVTGATILGTGDICMILNPPDLLKSLQRKPVSETLTLAQAIPDYQPVILLVEDSPPVRIQEKRLFEAAGYEVVIATNGQEGYNTLKTRKFDAVVSDVEMPYLDGFSLATKIRHLSEYDDLPIILVTTLDSDEDRKRGADAGANAYILKGRFNQEALLDALERLI